MIIAAHAYARAGLVGNPSDGYFGKTISFIIRNFAATVRLWESPHFEIVPAHGDFARFDSVAVFLHDLKLHGYYGGFRIIKAAVKKFIDHCRRHGIDLSNCYFNINFYIDIPSRVTMYSSGLLID